LAGFTAVEDPEAVNYDLLALLNISQYIDGVPLDAIVPAFLGVIVTGMIDTTCIKEDTPFPHIVPKGESVRPYDSKVQQGRIVGVNIMHREEGLSLVRGEHIDLPAYRYWKGLAVKYSFGHSDDGLFGEDACTPMDLSCGDQSFALPKDLLKHTLGHSPSSTFSHILSSLQFHIRGAVTSHFIVCCRRRGRVE
jgi:hypothetical protein